MSFGLEPVLPNLRAESTEKYFRDWKLIGAETSWAQLNWFLTFTTGICACLNSFQVWNLLAFIFFPRLHNTRSANALVLPISLEMKSNILVMKTTNLHHNCCVGFFFDHVFSSSNQNLDGCYATHSHVNISLFGSLYKKRKGKCQGAATRFITCKAYLPSGYFHLAHLASPI